MNIIICGAGRVGFSISKQLSEVDIASVITYTRDSWSNGKNGDGEIVVPKDIVDYKNRAKL